ncbi:MAG: bifunctional ADP-heptose synthase [Bacteroidota bacterium]|nr:bifunctional ADP-heptose synthase [Bacteroidota bacterium]
MNDLSAEYQRFKKELSAKHILVIGDVMIDRYQIGTVNRLSPEAPVPVLDWKITENTLGGAANVLHNLLSLGCQASLVSVCGDDEESTFLEKLLNSMNPGKIYLLKEPQRLTTVKTRMMNDRVQLLRLDKESQYDITKKTEQQLSAKILELIEEQIPDVIILQDYNKGLFTQSFIHFILDYSKLKNIPVCVDPKKKHFFEFQGVRLFKPNLKEASESMQRYVHADINITAKLAKDIQRELVCDSVLLTLGADGSWFESQETSKHFKTIPRMVKDVSGAGDCVISLAALCIACSLTDEMIPLICNVAGGHACEIMGVNPIDKQRFMLELDEIFKHPNT